MSLTAGTKLGRYETLSKLGAGGMGEVYLAQDTMLNRRVALKILSAEFANDKDRMSRFVREAQSASALNHPNIITIYEIGKSEDIHFIATEFIQGETLHKRLQHESPNLKTTLDTAIQITSALDAAHRAGIIHRDIKPDNVMIRPDGLVKILDFGIAKLSESRSASVDEEAATALKQGSTSPGTIVGTANYMSPEQARGKEVDARSDIFSFGLVLYELLTGTRAFAGENALDVIGAILHKEPTPPTQIRPDLPAEIERIVNKTLRKDVEDRYQTARDLLTDLKDVRRELDFQDKLERTVAPESHDAKTQPVSAASTYVPATSSAEFIARGIQSHKLSAAIVSLILLALVGSGIWFFVLRRSFINDRDKIGSIAVMPFVNENNSQDVEYLTDGMTETLIKSLSNLPDLNVKPRSSVFRYKGKDTDLKTIARELNVEAILNGRVVQRGDQLTISLELVNAQKESVIWTEQYERKTSDLVSLQGEIARDVSTKLKSKLSGAEETKLSKVATTDPEAYQAYLKGRYYWNRRTSENLKKAIEQFKAATDRDPNYALAFVGLADCYTVLSEYAGIPTSETAPQARSYAERAIAIDPELAEPHATLASVNRQLWQWAQAEKEAKRAIEINPNYPTAYHWYSILLKDMGRNDEAAALIKRGHELDPMSSVISVNVSELYQLQKNYDGSIETCMRLIELDPNYAGAYEDLGISYIGKGQNVEAIAAAEKAAELAKRSGVVLGSLGYVYASAGKRTEALAVIKELEDKYSRKEAGAIDVASVYAGLRENDKAFEWLEKDFQSRNGKLAVIRWSVTFEPLWSDPRFKDLLKRMGLPV